MHPALQYILACLGAGVIGLLSAAAVFSLACFLNRRAGARLETTFAFVGLVGLGMMFVGGALESRILSAASVLLWGWIVLPILLIPPLLLWRLVARCLHRLVA